MKSSLARAPLAPARLAPTDLTGWRLRGPKAVLALVAMATRSLHRVVGFSGRDDTAEGWIVKRVRDPHYCSAHSRDRAEHRATPAPSRRAAGTLAGVRLECTNAGQLVEYRPDGTAALLPADR